MYSAAEKLQDTSSELPPAVRVRIGAGAAEPTPRSASADTVPAEIVRTVPLKAICRGVSAQADPSSSLTVAPLEEPITAHHLASPRAGFDVSTGLWPLLAFLMETYCTPPSSTASP